MVYALEQTHRMLAPHGYLVDLRPFRNPRHRRTTLPQVACVLNGREVPVGVLEESVADDLAADRAVQHVLGRGLFTLQSAETLRFRAYFRTLEIFDTFRKEAAGSAPRTWRDNTFRASSRRRLQALLHKYPQAQIVIVELVRLNVMRKL